MYSANDFQKAFHAVFDEMKRQERSGESQAHGWNHAAIAKAALDAQYLPAQTPPSEGSAQCMIYRGKVWQE